MGALLPFFISFVTVAAAAVSDTSSINPHCLNGSQMNTKQVTHYMIPLLNSYNKFICDTMEGTCIYKKSGTQYMHNYGYPDELLAKERCKNGYGNSQNCLHPCRTLAASMKYHRFGQVVFIKELVGKKCGNLKRDGFELVHDGYMVIADTGSPKHFNAPGRFDFFWGRCANDKSGECMEGAIPISDATSDTPFCTVYDPSKPSENEDIRNMVLNKIRNEDLQRGDTGAAADVGNL